jgi:hypothetical protein
MERTICHSAAEMYGMINGLRHKADSISSLILSSEKRLFSVDLHFLCQFGGLLMTSNL